MTLLETENKGIRVCLETAELIKKLVAQALRHFGRVPKGHVQSLRETALRDQQFHKAWGPN